MLLKELAWTLVLLSTGGIYLQLFLKREKKNMIKKKIIRLKKEVYFKMQNFKFSIKLHSEIYFIVSSFQYIFVLFRGTPKHLPQLFLLGLPVAEKGFLMLPIFFFSRYCF